MSLSTAQEKFYWRLWAAARKADPTLDRKEVHAELKLPGSHRAFGQRDFDRFKGRCEALARPGDMVVQMEQDAMGLTRRRWVIAMLCRALAVDEAEYPQALLKRMNRRGEMGGRELLVVEMGEGGLERIIIALRKECRRHWATKPELLRAVTDFAMAEDLDHDEANARVARALHTPSVPDLSRLHWDELIIVLAVVRSMSRAEAVL